MQELYQGPIKTYTSGRTVEIWQGNWIRLYRQLYVSRPGDNPTHLNMASGLGIRDLIESTRSSDPTQVDAGKFLLNNISSRQVTRRQIRISGNSTSLNLPVESAKKRAREISDEVWNEQSPGFVVINE